MNYDSRFNPKSRINSPIQPTFNGSLTQPTENIPQTKPMDFVTRLNENIQLKQPTEDVPLKRPTGFSEENKKEDVLDDPDPEPSLSENSSNKKKPD